MSFVEVLHVVDVYIFTNPMLSLLSLTRALTGFKSLWPKAVQCPLSFVAIKFCGCQVRGLCSYMVLSLQVTPDPMKDDDLMTKTYFLENFITRQQKHQAPGIMQSEGSGKFATKTNDKLSWRGMIQRLYRDFPTCNVTCIACAVNYSNGQSLIKHIERKHEHLPNVEID